MTRPRSAPRPAGWYACAWIGRVGRSSCPSTARRRLPTRLSWWFRSRTYAGSAPWFNASSAAVWTVLRAAVDAGSRRTAMLDPMRIDLHTHSTVSDGTVPPAELIRAAADARLDAVALTDHDSVAGWEVAAAEAGRAGIEFVPGVELSCRWYGVEPAISLHLLAYFVDPADPDLTAEMARVRASRERRAERIVELMRADGVDVTYDEVLGYAGNGTVGRPHLAQALIKRGLAATVSEAFAPSMLGQRWRVPKEDTDVFLALRLV